MVSNSESERRNNIAVLTRKQTEAENLKQPLQQTQGERPAFKV